MNNIDNNIELALKKFNTEYINKVKDEICRFKKYDLQRLKTDKLHKCDNNECLKNAIYLDRKNSKHLCWYHGLLATK
jgi:hypothetical protein